MAMKLKPITTSYGITIMEPYFMINSVQYNDKNNTIDFEGVIYLNQSLREQGGDFLPEMNIYGSCSGEKGTDYIATCYNFIKQKTLEVNGKTKEEIHDYNQQIINEYMSRNLPPEGCLDDTFLIFIDEEDC